MTAWTKRAALLAATLALVAGAVAAAATASTDVRGGAGATKTVKVGFIWSKTGPLAGFAQEEYEGYLYGLLYARTHMKSCGGYKIQTNFVDDQTSATNAVNAAKDLIGQGYHILAGSIVSGIALQVAPIADQNNVLFISGGAAADAITGVNRHTFRAGRQSFQDVQAARNILGSKATAKKIVVFAEDTAFGASNFAAVNQIFGAKGHTVTKILVPFQAADLTPYAQQLKNAHADLVFVAWAGSNAPAMWQSLDQQGVLDSTTVTTGLPDRVNYPFLGQLMGSKVKYLSHYVYQAPKNAVNTWLVKQMKRNGEVPDLFEPDGFNIALMVCHAVAKAGGDGNVDKLISSLEGWKFTGVKGIERIRQSDHALTQPMFSVQLIKQSNGSWEPKVLGTFSSGLTQPPVSPFPK
jgi:branched-chain amino acid transport system substrate-binding protein